MKAITPVQVLITKDTVNTNFKGRYFSFFVTGTYSVEIDNLIFMPGDVFTRDVNTNSDEYFDITPQIKFMEETASTSENKRLRQGKRILIEYVKIK